MSLTMDFNPPPAGTILYKYYPPQTTKIVLESRSVRFSPIAEFNDPFELHVFPNESFTPFEFGHALANHVLQVIKRNESLPEDRPLTKLIDAYRAGKISGVSDEDFAIFVGGMMVDKQFVTEPSEWQRVVHRRLTQALGAFCLSESYSSLLMWAHYARNHEGFVLGFDVAKAGSAFEKIAKVSYCKDYPKNDNPWRAADSFLGRTSQSQGNGSNHLRHNLFTKSEEWQYEKEWRVLKGTDSGTLVELPTAAFATLYVGCRSNIEAAKDLVAVARIINPNIKVWKTRISTSAFALEFCDVDEAWSVNYPSEDQVIG